jgi:predicted transcriptional regulator
MKQQHRHQHHLRHHPHRQHRSNLDIIANILKLALTRVGNGNKIIHKTSLAYEQLSYYLEIMMIKGMLDMDRTE